MKDEIKKKHPATISQMEEQVNEIISSIHAEILQNSVVALENVLKPEEACMKSKYIDVTKLLSIGFQLVLVSFTCHIYYKSYINLKSCPFFYLHVNLFI